VEAASTPWQHLPFASAQVGAFTAEVDATPLAGDIDAGIGLSYAALDDFNRLACVVRFNPAGFIDARNGDSYQGASIRYASGTAYHFRFEVRVPSDSKRAGLYSVYVTPAGAAERPVGINLAFRADQPPIPYLSSWSLFADVGRMRAWQFSAAASAIRARAGWLNRPFARQTGQFTAELDATPLASKLDAFFGVADGAQNSLPGFTCLVHFTPEGMIAARDRGSYPASPARYEQCVSYHFRLVIDVRSQRYSVYVAAPGASEQQIAFNYALGPEHHSVHSLNSLCAMVNSASGQLRLANFVVRGGLDRFGIKELNTTLPGGREYFARWNNGIPRKLDWGMDRWDPEFHVRGDSILATDGHGIMQVAGEAPRLYVYDPAFTDKQAYSPRRFKSWSNVEITVYFKRVSDQKIDWAGMVTGAKIRHAPDEDLCGDRGYYGKFYNTGEIGFVKEVYHHDDKRGYPSRGSENRPWKPLPSNRWIGYKFVARDVDMGQHVHLEVWADLSNGVNGGSWKKLCETVDTGDWGRDAPACAKGVDPAQILTGPNLSVFIRNDGVNRWLYKLFSVREIAAK
jgi:hypothetical protein